MYIFAQLKPNSISVLAFFAVFHHNINGMVHDLSEAMVEDVKHHLTNILANEETSRIII